MARDAAIQIEKGKIRRKKKPYISIGYIFLSSKDLRNPPAISVILIVNFSAQKGHIVVLT